MPGDGLPLSGSEHTLSAPSRHVSPVRRIRQRRRLHAQCLKSRGGPSAQPAAIAIPAPIISTTAKGTSGSRPIGGRGETSRAKSRTNEGNERQGVERAIADTGGADPLDPGYDPPRHRSRSWRADVTLSVVERGMRSASPPAATASAFGLVDAFVHSASSFADERQPRPCVLRRSARHRLIPPMRGPLACRAR